MFSEVPDSVKNLVKYAINGGNVEELFSKMASQPTSKITKDMDLEDEKNLAMIVKTSKKAEGEDDETTEAYIEFLKESGKLKAVASKMHEKIVEKDAELAAQEATKAAEQKRTLKERQRKFKNEMSSLVSETKEFNGVKLNDKDSKELPSYIADATVEMEDGRKVTNMQRDLFAALQDKNKTVLLAKILRDDFDFKDISKAEKTKYSREVKQNLQRSKTLAPSKSAGSSQRKAKALADFF